MPATLRLALTASLVAFTAPCAFAAITGVVINADGQPIAGARVSIYAPELPRARASRLVSDAPQAVAVGLGKSDPKGSFSIEAKLPVVDVRIEAAGYAPKLTRAASDDDLGAVALTKAEMKSGTVTAGGKPVAGAVVVCDGYQTTTDANGKYSVPDPAALATRLFVYHRDFAPSDETRPPLQLNRTLDVGVAINGKVIDDAGAAVAGATIAVDGVPLATSGADGTFTVAHAARTWQKVEARTDRHGGTQMRAAHGEVLIRVARTVTVTGVVRDFTSKKPLAGATVALGAPHMPGPSSADEPLAMTDALGNFTFTRAPGLYDLMISRPGYGGARAQVRAGEGQAAATDLRLWPAPRIIGSVVDEEKRPVAGARISSQSPAAEPAYSAPDGRFVFRSGGFGEVQLVVAKPGHVQASTPPIRLLGGQQVTGVVVTIPRGGDGVVRAADAAPRPAAIVRDPALTAGLSTRRGAIAGRVIDKVRGTPVRSFRAGVSQRPDAKTYVPPLMMFDFANEDGMFTLPEVPAGPATLVVAAPGYTWAVVRDVPVEAGQTVSNVEVALGRGVKLSGRVTGTDGLPLRHVSIRPEPATTPVPLSAVTDANGVYSIDGFEPGEKTVVFSARGYAEQSKNVALSSDERLDVQLEAGRRVTGIIVTEDGAPVPEADLELRMLSPKPAENLSARSDASGMFAFDGVVPGHYTFSASKRGAGKGAVSDFDATSGAPLRIVLQRGGVIYGHVSGVARNEVEWAAVTAIGDTSKSWSRVDERGNFRIEDAPTGSVQVLASVSGNFENAKKSAVKWVQVERGGTAQVELEFRTLTVITGRVTRGGRPVPRVRVAFVPVNQRVQTIARLTTDDAGVYSTNGLEAALYTVDVIDVGPPPRVFSAEYEVKGSATFDIDLTLTSAHGRVIDASTGGPIADAQVFFGVPPRANTKLIAAASVATDANGNFVVDSLTPATYAATASKAGYGNVQLDVVVPQNGASNVEFKLAPSAGVTLRVVDARSGGVINANVRVDDLQGRSIASVSPMAGAPAEETKLPLARGQYRARIAAAGYAPQTVPISSPSQQTIAMTPGGTLAIKSRSAAPQRGRLVTADGAIYPYRGESGIFIIGPSPGTTTLPQIAPGTYHLQVLGATDAPVNSVEVVVGEGAVQRTEI